MNVSFPYDHDNPQDCQLLIALTGDAAAIKEKLQSILAEFDRPYGKPCQGTYSQYQITATIKTPVWKGKEY